MITIDDIHSNEENYNWWLTIMPDSLLLLAALPIEVRKYLDYSVESLNIIELYILENYSFEDMILLKNKVARDLFARYIGETFRKNLKDLIWSIELNDPKHVFFGLPILIKKDKFLDLPTSPYSLVTVIINRNSKNILSNLLKYLIEKERNEVGK